MDDRQHESSGDEKAGRHRRQPEAAARRLGRGHWRRGSGWGEPTASWWIIKWAHGRPTRSTVPSRRCRQARGHEHVPTRNNDARVLRASAAPVHVLRSADCGALVADISTFATIPYRNRVWCIEDWGIRLICFDLFSGASCFFWFSVPCILQSLPPNFVIRLYTLLPWGLVALHAHVFRRCSS